MMIGLAAVALIALGYGTFWAYLRATQLIFPVELTETVEAEGFRQWLMDTPQSEDWFVAGKDAQDRIYLVSHGAVAARRLHSRVLSKIGRERPGTILQGWRP